MTKRFHIFRYTITDMSLAISRPIPLALHHYPIHLPPTRHEAISHVLLCETLNSINAVRQRTETTQNIIKKNDDQRSSARARVLIRWKHNLHEISALRGILNFA